jgi:hypothetical protein
MASIRCFEEIEAWQEARRLTKAVYGVTRHGAFAADRGLASQVQQAAVSVMSNIAEGFDTDAEFTSLYGHAQTVRRMVTSFIKYLRVQQAPVNPRTYELANSPTHEPANL